MWKCENCKRNFAKTNQSHSCRTFPLDEHFKNKESQRNLFNDYIDFVKKNVGDFNIEALPCCIHLVSKYTFGAVWILSDKIRIDFMATKKLTSNRISRIEQPSANRFVHYLEIRNKQELDKELLEWLKDAYFLKTE